MADQATTELVIERIFDAPRERVWEAWTNPEQLKKWWGPKDFTAPEGKIDLRVGGKYLFAMQSPEFNGGAPIWSTGTYREIIPMERLVMTDSFADEQGNVVPSSHYGMEGFPMELEVTVGFEELPDGKTKMTLRHAGHPVGMVDDATTGWNESLDKLAANL